VGIITFEEHEGLLLAQVDGDPGEAAERLINAAAVPALGHVKAGFADVWIAGQDRLAARFSSRSRADLQSLAERARSGVGGLLTEVEWLDVQNVRDRWAFRGEATEPDPARRNPRAAPWERAHVLDDDVTIRLEYVHGVVDDLQRVDVYEDDEEVRITALLGLDPGFEGGGVALVGLGAWTEIRLNAPLGTRRIRDGALVQEPGNLFRQP
jgi:hypothetical protein